MADSMVKVGAYDDMLRAHFVRTLLEDSDIHVEIRDEFLVQADPLLANAVGGIKVFVPASQLNRAREILADERDGSLEGELPDSVSGLRCPECGDQKMQFGQSFHVWIASVILLFVLPLLVPAESTFAAYRIHVVMLSATIAFVGFWVAVLRKFPLKCPKCGYSGMRSTFEPTFEDED